MASLWMWWASVNNPKKSTKVAEKRNNQPGTNKAWMSGFAPEAELASIARRQQKLWSNIKEEKKL